MYYTFLAMKNFSPLLYICYIFFFFLKREAITYWQIYVKKCIKIIQISSGQYSNDSSHERSGNTYIVLFRCLFVANVTPHRPDVIYQVILLESVSLDGCCVVNSSGSSLERSQSVGHSCRVTSPSLIVVQLSSDLHDP